MILCSLKGEEEEHNQSGNQLLLLRFGFELDHGPAKGGKFQIPTQTIRFPYLNARLGHIGLLTGIEPEVEIEILHNFFDGEVGFLH